MTSKKLIVFDTHPVQYRVQIYQHLERLDPGSFVVIYANNSSVVGYADKDFGLKIAWDIPLLEGYSYEILETQGANTGEKFSDIRGDGVGRLMRKYKPARVLLTGLQYQFYWQAYFLSLLARVPVWLRLETQDEAFHRGRVKSFFRGIAWRLAYSGISKAFYIGKLNKAHFVKHGILESKLIAGLYATENRQKNLSDSEKYFRRSAVRGEYNIASSKIVIGFFGKFIEKKNPMLIISALSKMKSRDRFVVLFVGGGILQEKLEREAIRAGVTAIFTGFVNQSKLADYYLATDISVLPSNRSGETWGLVVNEALQAGCATIVTNAVGCHKDFEGIERFRTIDVGSSEQLAVAFDDLSLYPRDFNWSGGILESYTLENVAKNIARELSKL